MKMKNVPRRYDIKRPRSRPVHKHSNKEVFQRDDAYTCYKYATLEAQFMKELTLITLGFFRVVFLGGGQFEPSLPSLHISGRTYLTSI